MGAGLSHGKDSSVPAHLDPPSGPPGGQESQDSPAPASHEGAVGNALLLGTQESQRCGNVLEVMTGISN